MQFDVVFEPGSRASLSNPVASTSSFGQVTSFFPSAEETGQMTRHWNRLLAALSLTVLLAAPAAVLAQSPGDSVPGTIMDVYPNEDRIYFICDITRLDWQVHLTPGA